MEGPRMIYARLLLCVPFALTSWALTWLGYGLGAVADAIEGEHA